MVQIVLRFQVDDDRRVSVLFEDRRGTEGALEAVDLVPAHDAAKRMEGFASFLMIVWERIEPALHLLRCIRGLDDGSFSRGERRPGRGWTRARFDATALLVD
jgi:hypothetical protein